MSSVLVSRQIWGPSVLVVKEWLRKVERCGEWGGVVRFGRLRFEVGGKEREGWMDGIGSRWREFRRVR